MALAVLAADTVEQAGVRVLVLVQEPAVELVLAAAVVEQELPVVAVQQVLYREPASPLAEC